MTTESNPIKEAARSYAERGYRLVELHTSTGGCCSCHRGFKCGSKGKHPIRGEWQKTEALSGADIETMFGDDAKVGLGIATGPESGIFVVDVDGERGNDTMRDLVAAGNPMPSTYTVETGSGGWHFYFTYPNFEIGNSASTKVGPGVDTRGKGGYVVAPPSISDKGPYKIARDFPVVDAPDWLLELLRPKERKAPTEPLPLSNDNTSGNIPTAEQQRLDGYTDGAIANEIARLKALHWAGDPTAYRGEPWDNTVFEVACNLIQLANADWSRLTVPSAWDRIRDNSPTDQGFDAQRIIDKFDSALKKVDHEPTPYPTKPVDILSHMTGTPPAPSVDPIADTNPFDDLVLSAANDDPPPPPPSIDVVEYSGISTSDEHTLDPTHRTRAKAAILGPLYSSRAHIQENLTDASFWDLQDFITTPTINGDQDPDLKLVDQWIRRTLRSGTPELLWAAVGALIAGTDTSAPTIVFKGGGPLLALLARILNPAVGDESETILAGPRFSTRATGVNEIVFEFDETETIDLTAYADAIVTRANAATGTLAVPDIDTHDELEKLTDYRAAQLHRARLGLGSRARVNGETDVT